MEERLIDTLESDLKQKQHTNHHSNKNIPSDVDISNGGDDKGYHGNRDIVQAPDKPPTDQADDPNNDRNTGSDSYMYMEKLISEYLEDATANDDKINSKGGNSKVEPSSQEEEQHGIKSGHSLGRESQSYVQEVVKADDIDSDLYSKDDLGLALKEEVDAVGLSFTPDEAAELINVLKSYITNNDNDADDDVTVDEEGKVALRGIASKRGSRGGSRYEFTSNIRTSRCICHFQNLNLKCY